MSPDASKLLKQALKLPAEERAEVAGQLLRSLEDQGDDLDKDDRERLHAALANSEEDLAAGHYRDAADVLAELRQRRR